MRRRSCIEFVKAKKFDINIIGTNNSGVNTIFYKKIHECFCRPFLLSYGVYASTACLLINIFDLYNVSFLSSTRQRQAVSCASACENADGASADLRRAQPP
jgi:hypothetical protein